MRERLSSDAFRSIIEKSFGPLETRVMEVLWNKQSATVQEIVEELNDEKNYAYTTILTILTRLTRKGMLDRIKEGRMHRYRPRYTKEEWVKKVTSQAVEGLLSDFGELAIAQFVDTVGSTPEQLEKLKRLIRELERREED
ncbi:BlaI/MecI/CopY family transcriptional regulator [Polycladomyces zharkentensis]